MSEEKRGNEQALTGDSLTKALQEHAELGHEYRYRDTMMVQEFYLSMVVLSFSLGAIADFSDRPIVRNGILVFGLMVLVILALHLRNTNQDRVSALKAKAEVAKRLGFANPHLNVSGLNRTSAPRLMLLFTVLAAISWAVATVLSIAADVGAR